MIRFQYFKSSREKEEKYQNEGDGRERGGGRRRETSINFSSIRNGIMSWELAAAAAAAAAKHTCWLWPGCVAVTSCIG